MKTRNNSTYAARKEAARQEGIEWQRWQADENLSYGELAYFMEYFERIARRFGLVREFRENAII